MRRRLPAVLAAPACRGTHPGSSRPAARLAQPRAPSPAHPRRTGRVHGGKRGGRSQPWPVWLSGGARWAPPGAPPLWALPRPRGPPRSCDSPGPDVQPLQAEGRSATGLTGGPSSGQGQWPGTADDRAPVQGETPCGLGWGPRAVSQTSDRPPAAMPGEAQAPSTAHRPGCAAPAPGLRDPHLHPQGTNRSI